jgi:hypothetical protein
MRVTFQLWGGFVVLLAGLLIALGVLFGTDGADARDEAEQALQAEFDRCSERIFAKKAVTEKLLAGQLTLPQAVARFEELDATLSPRLRAQWRMVCPGDTDEECYYWTVLRYAAAAAQCRPRQARVLRERLEGQLPEHLRRRLADEQLSAAWYTSPRPTREQAESLRN